MLLFTTSGKTSYLATFFYQWGAGLFSVGGVVLISNAQGVNVLTFADGRGGTEI